MKAPTPDMDKAALALHGSLDGGAAPKLSKSLAKEICQTLAKSTKPLIRLCSENSHWPSYDELHCRSMRLPWLRSMIVQARKEQADFLAQDCMNLEHDLLADRDVSMSWVQANKVVMEQRRWYASKIQREVYGDDPNINVATQVNVSVPQEKLSSIRERLEAARTLVPPPEKEEKKKKITTRF